MSSRWCLVLPPTSQLSAFIAIHWLSPICFVFPFLTNGNSILSPDSLANFSLILSCLLKFFRGQKIFTRHYTSRSPPLQLSPGPCQDRVPFFELLLPVPLIFLLPFSCFFASFPPSFTFTLLSWVNPNLSSFFSPWLGLPRIGTTRVTYPSHLWIFPRDLFFLCCGFWVFFFMFFWWWGIPESLFPCPFEIPSPSSLFFALSFLHLFLSFSLRCLLFQSQSTLPLFSRGFWLSGILTFGFRWIAAVLSHSCLRLFLPNPALLFFLDYLRVSFPRSGRFSCDLFVGLFSQPSFFLFPMQVSLPLWLLGIFSRSVLEGWLVPRAVFFKLRLFRFSSKLLIWGLFVSIVFRAFFPPL